MMNPHHARQRGQALVIGLALLLAGAVALFTLFNTSQVSADKARLINAADAGAYSAALWQARVLNYQAYANRAIVVTEIHVAQGIALAGWTEFLERLAISFDHVANVIFVLKPYSALIREVATTVAEAVTEASAIDIQLRAAEGYGYKNLLHASQVVMNQVAGSVFATNAIAFEVAHATDARFFAWAIESPQPMARSYETTDERRRFAALIAASAPDFIAKGRNAQFDAGGEASGGLLSCVTPVLKKRGATVLSDDLERWESADTLSVHQRGGGLFGAFRGCREQTPFGWGGAEATDNGFEDRITTGANGLADNARARDRIGQDDGMGGGTSLVQFDGYSGITAFQDLDFEQLGENSRFPTRRVVVLARMDEARLRTGNALNLGVGRLRQRERMPRNRLYAAAAAEVYFKRPASSYAGASSEDIELASLFNPYWQARLSAVGESDRQRALDADPSQGPEGG